MKKQHLGTTLFISLIVIVGVIGLSACASVALAEPKDSLEAQVSTAVAATLIQQMIETEVAEQSMLLVTEPALQATEPPVPTPTPVPTESAQPTVAATVEAAQPTPTATPVPPSSPKIIADQDTNCRVGPSTGYKVETYFLEGSESTVEGRDQGKDWWYIVNPTDASGFCWVWDGSTTVVGDTSTVPVVAAPADGYHEPSYGYYYNYYPYYPYHPYYPNYWKNFCKQNPEVCDEIKWGTCNPYDNCTCKPVYQYPCYYPCKKSNCPPVTEVNYKNYCTKYPKCCDY